jgi:hypothetical protein
MGMLSQVDRRNRREDPGASVSILCQRPSRGDRSSSNRDSKRFARLELPTGRRLRTASSISGRGEW